MDPQALEYVRAEMRDGKNAEQIKQSLLASGWKPADVDEVIRAAVVSARPIMTPQAPPPPPAAPNHSPGSGSGQAPDASTNPAQPIPGMPTTPGQIPGTTTTSGWSIGSRGLRFGYRRPLSPTGSKILALVFVAVGALVAYFGVNQYLAAKHLAEVGVKVPGTVVRIDEKTETKHENNRTYTQTLYRPVVSYTLQSGETKEYASDTWRNPSSFSVGQRIEMIYDPADTSKVAINTAGEMYFGPIAMGILGLIFVIAGLIAFIQSLMRRTG